MITAVRGRLPDRRHAARRGRLWRSAAVRLAVVFGGLAIAGIPGMLAKALSS